MAPIRAWFVQLAVANQWQSSAIMAAHYTHTCMYTTVDLEVQDSQSALTSSTNINTSTLNQLPHQSLSFRIVSNNSSLVRAAEEEEEGAERQAEGTPSLFITLTTSQHPSPSG